jgi:CheY-like chemotaxis protein
MTEQCHASSPTVLLVDDETAIRSLLARRLEASGDRDRAVPLALGRRLAMTVGATDTALRLMGESNMQCLRKPFTEAELREALKTALSGPEKPATQ